ncbi:hypothetical protein [Bacillus sp. T33-2]|uniref:hypothetical protein n=1 Tax=Bacillus sp. T33-2 TaxID=2054168 RepID=UPI000C78065A|nr:hypothetical protein [Bacillus sp. T33-2]PLR95794.1 hypothetical protein CVD19_13780 [Bacillus sp. T33-2]
MVTVLTYFVCLIFIVISVFITLTFKNELERMFREEKEVFVFHIFNVLITLTVAFASQAVITIYVVGHRFHFIRDALILLAITLPIYILGHLAFERCKTVYRKYAATENGKVLVLNEKYVKQKKRFKTLRHYNVK